MIDHIGIGHAPILSDQSIIASPDLSGAYRYLGRRMADMEIGQKLREAREERGMNQTELAHAIGLKSQSVISEIEGGKLGSWPKHADKISRVLGRPRHWFEGDAHIGSAPDIPEVIDASADLPDLVPIAEYDVRLSAGGGFYVDRETTRRTWTLPRWLVVDQLGLSPQRATIQEVIGDSMEPTLKSGDYVLIDLRDQRIGLPGIFAVWDGDALVCKRVERIPGSDPEQVRIRSDNPLHGEYTVSAEQVRVIGRVRWFTRRM